MRTMRTSEGREPFFPHSSLIYPSFIPQPSSLIFRVKKYKILNINLLISILIEIEEMRTVFALIP